MFTTKRSRAACCDSLLVCWCQTRTDLCASPPSPQGLCSWARLHKAFPWVPLSPLQARGGHALFASFYFWVTVVTPPTQLDVDWSDYVPRPSPPPQAVTAGVVCGLAVLLEKPSRRIELALYTTTQALRAAPRGGRVGERALGHAAVPAFAAGLGILMHHYVRHPETIRPSYLVRGAAVKSGEKREGWSGGVGVLWCVARRRTNSIPALPVAFFLSSFVCRCSCGVSSTRQAGGTRAC